MLSGAHSYRLLKLFTSILGSHGAEVARFAVPRLRMSHEQAGKKDGHNRYAVDH